MAAIVLVESDASIREEVKRVLEAEGYEISDTGDGKTCVDLVRQVQPQVVILSVELSQGQNGYILCNRLRKDDALKEIPIVMIGNPDGFQAHGKLKARANEYVPKPLKLEDLVAAVTKIAPQINFSDLVIEMPGEESVNEEVIPEVSFETDDVGFSPRETTPDIALDTAIDTEPGFKNFELEGTTGSKNSDEAGIEIEGSDSQSELAARDARILELEQLQEKTAQQLSDASSDLVRRETQMKALAQRVDSLLAEKKSSEPEVLALKQEVESLRSQAKEDEKNREMLKKTLSEAIQLLNANT